MDHRSALRLGLVAWTIAFIVAFIDLPFVTGSGAEISAGISFRKFVIWQGIAAALAVFVWIKGSRFELRSAPRVASRIPGVIAIAMVIAVGLFLLTAGFITPVMNGAVQ